jgi:hypothetical protein
VCLWLANSIFIILLLLFGGESWGQSKSTSARAPAAGPTQSSEEKEMSLKGPIEQPSHDNKDLPAFENREQSRLGPETDGIQKQKSTIRNKVKHTGVKSHLPKRSQPQEEQFNLKSESNWVPYRANSDDSLKSSTQFSWQEKPMAPSTESFTKSEVYDEDNEEEMNNKVKEIAERYKKIEQVPVSVLNEDSEIKELLEEYLERIKRKDN